MLQMIFSVNTLWWMILLLYIPACFGLIVIVLLQKGKGQGLAGAFGMGGGMDTIFGPRSSKSLPQKITYGSAAVFMTLALVMSILSGKVGRASAPELIADAPPATMEALFDPNAMPDDAAPALVDDVDTSDALTPEDQAPAPMMEFDVDIPEVAEVDEANADTTDGTPEVEAVEATPDAVVTDTVSVEDETPETTGDEASAAASLEAVDASGDGATDDAETSVE